MTSVVPYGLKRYTSFEEYLEDDELSSERNYRLLSTGEVIEAPDKSAANLIVVYSLIEALVIAEGIPFIKRIRIGDRSLQVNPLGDQWVHRKPAVMVLKPEHFRMRRRALLLGMLAPAFAAEVVELGDESSEPYLRDYVWKRQQYQDWQIPEYWIVDPQREQVLVLTLMEGIYQEKTYRGESKILSNAFPKLDITVKALLSTNVE